MKSRNGRVENIASGRTPVFEKLYAGIILGAFSSVVCVLLFLNGCGGSERSRPVARAKVRRMDLDIVVEKGGSIEAAKKREIRSEVWGENRIIYLIPEGTQVKKGDVLVRLDSSQLEERLTQQEIAYQTALANKIQAEEEYEIQVSQNESDIAQAELALEFAIMDLRKYTGYEGPVFADEGITKEVDPPAPGGAETAELVPAVGKETGSAGVKSSSATLARRIHPDLEALLQKPLREFTSGEAAQLWRQAESSLKLAEAELARASGEYEGSKNLYEKKFIAKTQLEADKISYERAKVNVQEAQESLRLLEEFTHPRNLKQYLSDVREKYRELERVKRKARAQLSRVKADLNSKISTYEHQKNLLEKLQDQVAKCTIRAPGPGMVVYARPRRGWLSEVMEEGSMVHERQVIIYLPDLSDLVVDVQIHESRISQIKLGQPAEITVDAFRGVTFHGKVVKVGILPDSVNRWLNPDLKVYEVLVSIDDNKGYELKPGMSANVKIFVERRPRVLCVPRQAVSAIGDTHYVQLVTPQGIEKRRVEIGKFNDFFVEVASGLKEGDEVLLAPLPSAVGKMKEAGKGKPQRAGRKKIGGIGGRPAAKGRSFGNRPGGGRPRGVGRRP